MYSGQRDREILKTIGLLGLVSFSTQRKTKEIGIRKVLGASMSGIYYLITREYAILLFIANLISWPLATFVCLTTPGAYKYQMNVWDYLLPAILIFIIAALSVAYHVVKAIRANPVQALRNE